MERASKAERKGVKDAREFFGYGSSLEKNTDSLFVQEPGRTRQKNIHPLFGLSGQNGWRISCLFFQSHEKKSSSCLP